MTESVACLELAGLILGVMGAFMMASGYMEKMIWWQLPLIFFKVFFKRATINGVRALSGHNQDDVIRVLRGLGLIALGFVLQVLAHLF